MDSGEGTLAQKLLAWAGCGSGFPYHFFEIRFTYRIVPPFEVHDSMVLVRSQCWPSPPSLAAHFHHSIKKPSALWRPPQLPWLPAGGGHWSSRVCGSLTWTSTQVESRHAWPVASFHSALCVQGSQSFAAQVSTPPTWGAGNRTLPQSCTPAPPFFFAKYFLSC